MRVLIVNTSERIGGAAVASYRLMEALKDNGVKAKMLVRDKQTEQITVAALPKSWRLKFNFVWERFVIWTHNRFSKRNLFAVDIANAGTDITSLQEFKEADVIHLAWINQGMLSLGSIKKIIDSGKPIVWTMHDQWPCTAICHNADGCDNYESGCHHCPYLRGGGSSHDLSYHVFEKKFAIYRDADITFIACSHWLENIAKKSKLAEGHEVLSIPNPINTTIFCKISKPSARERLHIPTDKKYILFGSVKISDKRKGVDYLIKACNALANEHPDLAGNIEVLVFGNRAEELEGQLPFHVRALGYISEERKQAIIYNAADLFVTPSLQENLPNMIMESMSCGTPCVGFNVGGIPEMIDHGVNGYVAKYKSTEDLAKGMYWTLFEADRDNLSKQCLAKVSTSYSERTVASQYINIYHKITNTDYYG
jgi:glycosyltransferase involved in cell wall biosynthesis